MSSREADANRLAAESLAVDDATGWFERLYAAAAGGQATVPWDRGGPHPLLPEWTAARDLRGDGRRALVVGCGFGPDAEHLAGLGFDTVAFDISESAVRSARERFPQSRVRYLTADLLDPPGGWRGGFDFVLESLTVQSLPDHLRPSAIAAVAAMVAPGGTLLVIASAREPGEPAGGPPWPLTRAEVESFAAGELEAVRIERFPEPPRWRAEFSRPAQ